MRAAARRGEMSISDILVGRSIRFVREFVTKIFLNNDVEVNGLMLSIWGMRWVTAA